jgi:glutathione S-transferase
MAEFKLHCFAQSGNCHKAALMLALSGADWEAVPVDFFNGQTRDPAWRETVNEMGEAPVLEHAGKRLTQSGVILIYLSRLLGKFGAENADQELDVLRWMFFDNHKFTSYAATYRFLNALAPQAPDPVALKFLRSRADAAYAILEKHLATHEFVAGSSLTIADLSLAGYVFFPPEEMGFDIKEAYPHIDAWRERIKAMPGWAGPYELMPGKRFMAQR